MVAPVHTVETIAYLDFKISEHHDRFLAVFPGETLTPKHHFLIALIEEYGPLVGVWTMCFEAKHSFFKQVVRHTKNLKNVLTLSTRHQMMKAYHLHTDVGQQALCVTKISVEPLDVLHSDIQEALRVTSPRLSTVQLANTVTYYGTRYTVGMILSYSSTGGLPDFAEIIQIAILDNCVHFNSFQLEDTGKIALLEQQKLGDVCGKPAYSVGGKCLVTLKHHICCSF